MFISLLIAQINIIEKGINSGASVLDTTIKSIDRYYNLLVTRYLNINNLISLINNNNSANNIMGF